jgi:hypothetical protein
MVLASDKVTVTMAAVTALSRQAAACQADSLMLLLWLCHTADQR